MVAALLAFLPGVRSPRGSRPVLPAEARTRFPDLAADLDLLDEVVTPEFAAYDERALRRQHAYRRGRLLLIVGSALVTGLGGLQAVFSEQRWPGILLAVLGVLLATGARFAEDDDSLDDYFGARVKAEKLRSLYFRVLARVEPYDGDGREGMLRRAVLDVRGGREP